MQGSRLLMFVLVLALGAGGAQAQTCPDGTVGVPEWNANKSSWDGITASWATWATSPGQKTQYAANAARAGWTSTANIWSAPGAISAVEINNAWQSEFDARQTAWDAALQTEIPWKKTESHWKKLDKSWQKWTLTRQKQEPDESEAENAWNAADDLINTWPSEPLDFSEGLAWTWTLANAGWQTASNAWTSFDQAQVPNLAVWNTWTKNSGNENKNWTKSTSKWVKLAKKGQTAENALWTQKNNAWAAVSAECNAANAWHADNELLVAVAPQADMGVTHTDRWDGDSVAWEGTEPQTLQEFDNASWEAVLSAWTSAENVWEASNNYWSSSWNVTAFQWTCAP